MKPAFWKLSMGYGSDGSDFAHVLEVLDWLRQGLVLVNKDTKAKGMSPKSQGEYFVERDRIGDYFYVCLGNQEPAILLFGQFTGPANLFSSRRDGWAERPFRWIKTSLLTKPYEGEAKWWAPNHRSTFVMVPEDEWGMFESAILVPYFDIKLADFRMGS